MLIRTAPRKGGGTVAIIGLSDANVALCRRGQPASIELDSHGGPPITVAVLIGESEEALAMHLNDIMGGVPMRDYKTDRENQLRLALREAYEAALSGEARDATIDRLSERIMLP